MCERDDLKYQKCVDIWKRKSSPESTLCRPSRPRVACVSVRQIAFGALNKVTQTGWTRKMEAVPPGSFTCRHQVDAFHSRATDYRVQRGLGI